MELRSRPLANAHRSHKVNSGQGVHTTSNTLNVFGDNKKIKINYSLKIDKNALQIGSVGLPETNNYFVRPYL